MRYRSVVSSLIVAAAFAYLPTEAGASWVPNPSADAATQGYLASSKSADFVGARDLMGVCHSGFQLTANPGDPPSGAVEIGRDDSTCTQTFRLGPLTPAAAKASRPADAEKPPFSRGRARLKARAAYSFKNAYFRTNVIGNYYGGQQTLAWVYNRVAWYYDGSCVHNPIDPGTVTGDNADFNQSYGDFASGASCSYAYSSTRADFPSHSGGPLCHGQPFGYVIFDRNSIHGNPNGSFSIYDGSYFCVDDLGPFKQFAWSYI